MIEIEALVPLYLGIDGGGTQTTCAVGDDLRVKWRGPVNKWCVIRASDSVILRANLPDKNVALETLAAIAQERAAIGN